MRTPQIDPLPGMSPLGLPPAQGENVDPRVRSGCPVCLGGGVPMGTLGRLDWYRCRQCGYDFSRGGDDQYE